MEFYDWVEWYAEDEFNRNFPPDMRVGCGCCESTYEVRELNWDVSIRRLRCRNFPACNGIGLGRSTDIGEVKVDRTFPGEWNEYFDVGQEWPDQ
jgi:hypothetical protein